MSWPILLTLMLGSLVLLFFVRIPVAFALFAVNLMVAVYSFGFGPGIQLFIAATQSSITTYVLTPIPLFILMGDILYHSGVVNRVVVAIDRLLGRVPGRLPLLTIGTGALVGVLSGSTSASTALLGRTMLPDMVRAGYPRQIALGSVLGAGGLAMIIPPSAIGIIWGATAGVSISKIFVSGFVPGLMMAAGYAALSILRSRRVPAVSESREFPHFLEATRIIVSEIAPAGLLIIGVLGSIFAGIATPTESGAVGVLGAVALAFFRGDVRRSFWMSSARSAARVTVMAFFIVAGSSYFSSLVSFSGAARGLVSLMTEGIGSPMLALTLMMLAMLVLGTFFESISLMLVVIPLYYPIVAAFGWDPVWFAILGLINIQIATTTPPFGLSLFVLKGVVGDEFRLTELYRAAMPFVGSDILVMIVLGLFPSIVSLGPRLLGG